MLVDTSAEGDLLANVCADGAGEDQLGGIVLDGGHLGAGGRGANVDHDDLVLGQLGDLGLLAVGRLDAEQTAQQVKVDFDLAVDVGQLALEAEDEADQTVGTAQRGVDLGADTNQATGHGVLEVVALRVEGDDAAEEGGALEGAAVVARDDAGADLDLVSQLEDAVQDTAAGNAALEIVNLGTGLVDVEGTDDDHARLHGQVADGHGDGVDNGVEHGIDVDLELGRDGDHGRLFGHGATDELEDRLKVLLRDLFSHQVDLVLQDDDVLQLHDLNGGQVLGCLGLRAGLVACNQKQRGVHDGGA